MRRRVHLHGAFASYHEGPLEIMATSVAEALEAVSRMVPGFRPNPMTGRQEVMVAGVTTERQLHDPTHLEDIHVFPAMFFSGGNLGGIFKMIVGSFMVIIGAVLMMVPGWQGAGFALLSAGLLTFAGGMLQILQPQPKNTPQVRSRYIANNGNTVAIGTPIPILYGRYLVGGQVLSLSVTSQTQPMAS